MRTSLSILTLVFTPILATACGGDDINSLTIYSGRDEELIGPLLDQFTEQTGIEIEMNDGKVHALRSDHPKGSYEKPLTRKEVEDKFRVYAKGVLPASATEEIIASVNALEQLPSVSALMDLLSPARRRDAA